MSRFDIYKSEGGKPKVFIVDNHQHSLGFDLMKEGKKRFKYSFDKLKMDWVFIVGDELYTENPHKRGQKVRLAIWRRRKGE